MIRAIKEFEGVRDGEVHPRTIKRGTKLTGDLAATAVAHGLAKEVDETPNRKKSATAAQKPATKRRRGAPAPEPQSN
jgi:hypothetical protein